MKKKKIIGVTVLLLAIGFAAVSTTLVLTGVIGIGANDDFSVIFTKALLNGEVSEKAVISADKKTITFTTNKMTMVDETQVLDYTVKNNSTQYDANVTINCTNLQSEYVTVVNTLDGTDITTDNETYMEAQESKDGNITVTMIKPYIEDEDTDLSITCNIVAEAVPRDDEVNPPDDDDDSDDPDVPSEIIITPISPDEPNPPYIIEYDDPDDDDDVVIPDEGGKIPVAPGKRVTGVFFADDSTCNLLLGTCNGKTAIVRKQTGWVYNHATQTVRKGSQVLNIGDYVNYDAVTGVDSSLLNYELKNIYSYSDKSFTAKSSTRFRVLGAENGQLLIISDSFQHNQGGSTGFMGNSYVKYKTELNNIASIYGHGEFADSVRSVRVSDINKITGYNPLAEGIDNPTAEQIKTGVVSNMNGKYGTVTTYTILSNTNYKTQIGENPENTYTFGSRSDGSKQVIRYYDINNEEITIKKNAGDEVRLKISTYDYSVNTLSSNRNGAQVGLATTSLAYDMLFNTDTYLLADMCVQNQSYGAFQVLNLWGDVSVYCGGGFNIIDYEDSYSGGSADGYDRAVIRIKNNTIVTLASTDSDSNGNEINTWNLS